LRLRALLPPDGEANGGKDRQNDQSAFHAGNLRIRL
jgi:hypothetical protein